MNQKQSCLFLILVVTLQCIFIASLGQQDEDPRKLYVVYMGEKKHEDPDIVTASHHDTLKSIFGSEEEARKSIVYSYRHGFSGFAAMLTESQAKEVAEMPEIISVTPNQHYPLHTTRSWDFLGLDYNKPEGLLRKANYGDGVIIGVIDTGIWPESESFTDTGYGPIPSRWRGMCQVGESNKTHCNRKLIGSRYYLDGVKKEFLKEESMSPRDLTGHGTHTASTAAGNLVPNIIIFGGSARGGAPRARLAIYKACWGRLPNGDCSAAAVAKAIDHAIHDGVDIISLSLDLGMMQFPYATLHAVLEGITVIASGGNGGPAPQSIRNDAPWILTVAASTIDRSYQTVITLGNNQKIVGHSLFREPYQVNNFTKLVQVTGCDEQTLVRTDFIGKIVLCSVDLEDSTVPAVGLSEAVNNVLDAGARGFIFAGYSFSVIESVINRKPCVAVDLEALMQIRRYINTTDNPVVKVAPSRTAIGSEVLAPKVIDFSSRGPSASFPGLLKPDITAPGVSIIAAVETEYRFDSGTSMSCPHVAGVAALLKSVHPDWSPAAIKSALVTTASINDAYGVPIEAQSKPPKLADPFDFGGGHIDPNRAADPGLIYDINPKDYLKSFECLKLEICRSTETPHYNLNLPSISIPDLTSKTTVERTVTNVGNADATYKAVVQAPPGVKMDVKPSVLNFNKSTKHQTFKVTFEAMRKVQGDFNFGSLTWVEVYGSHSVRMPIAVRTVIQACPAESP